MKAFVGITDFDWFKYLSELPQIDEVNFWQPSGHQVFRTLSPNKPFLFKLHSPRDYIVGGGLFAHSTILPISLAWDAFGEKNGASSLEEMRTRTEKYRRKAPSHGEDYQIGCILLQQPFFFEEKEWIPAPADWKQPIVQGKGYDTATGLGKKLWDDVQLRLQTRKDLWEEARVTDVEGGYGSSVMVMPRLGQGSFRVLVTDVYQRRCAVTQERTLPALDAVHIKPFGKSGPHSVSNGILFRSDIHKLFDSGYVTISDDYHFEVSKRIREEFENGRDYYSMHGRSLYLPPDKGLRPGSEFISWHNENVYRG
ncbi:MAG: HNH endonuclease [Thermodesulfobacteriota bacterium]